MKKELIVYVDLTDFYHEIGEGNAPGPHFIYNTIKEIKNKQPCVEQCGIVKAKLTELEIVQKSNFRSDTNNHKISFQEKYSLMKKALLEIKNKRYKGIESLVESTLEKVVGD